MSFFAPWKARGDTPTDPSSSSTNQQTSSGPITAPGGWSTLLTWRGQRQEPTISASSSNETFIDADTSTFGPSQINALNDRYYTTRSPNTKTAKARYIYESGENDEEYDNEAEFAAYTARTRQKGGGGAVTKVRAPIPFELDRNVVSRSKARSGTISSTTSSIASKDHSIVSSWSPFAPSEEKADKLESNAKSISTTHAPHSKGMDSADVSAELITRSTINDDDDDLETMSNFEGAIGDISLEAGPLDSAFQTLTRIQAKDVAATVNKSNRISSSSSSSNNPTYFSQKATLNNPPISPPRRQSTFDHQSRKMSIGGWYTPNESPTQTNDTWMQWGTSKIKATMPRGIASALFAVMGDADAKDEQGILRKDEDQNGAEFSDEEGENEENGKILVQDCVDVICEEKNGLLTLEGIFRISPSKALLKATKASYLKGQTPNLTQLCKRDSHLPAALLKDYLRSLRPPVFPESMYEVISDCPSDTKLRIDYIREELLPKLQSNRQSLLQQTFKCANMVCQHSSENRMDSSNLTVVLTPNLIHGENILQDIALCSVGKAEDGELEKKGSGTLGGIVKVCIENYDEIFSKEKAGEGHDQEQKRKDAE